jgi:hypothetical protein
VRPVVLGMNNPHSVELDDVLSPRFPGSAGCRLYQMVREVDTTVSEADYHEQLDRRNLITEGCWSKDRAKLASSAMLESLQGRRVVMLGTALPSVLGLRHLGKWYEWCVDHDRYMKWCVAPHPSGLNRIYNEVEYRNKTGRLLVDLIRGRA